MRPRDQDIMDTIPKYFLNMKLNQRPMAYRIYRRARRILDSEFLKRQLDACYQQGLRESRCRS